MIEFNVTEAFISRLIGEFSKQVPGITVHSEPTVSVPPEDTIKVVQGHMRHIITDLRANEIYKDQLSGGFSAMKVWTEYETPKSFKQKLCIDRVFDPLLCGWDPAAQKVHKGDGSYCFEMIPLTEEQFRAIYGDDINVEGCYKGNFEGFKWGYKNNRKNIILLCHYYEKQTKRVQLYELPGGTCLTKPEYEEMLEIYEKNGNIEQPPIPVNKRWTNIPCIYRYEIISDRVLECVQTDFCCLPLVFVDGNSVTLRRNGDGGTIEQIVRSYIHNAVGPQLLKNLAGQTIANHIENLVEHKMKIALESVPIGREDDYTNTQMVGNYLYNQYSPDGTQQYNPPQEVVKVPLPPEIVQAYVSAEQTIQASLGSYDAALGINKNQLSGVAIVEGATQSNAAAMPYIVNYLASLQQAADILLDLIPKYYVTPRSIPVLTNEDKREHLAINALGSPTMKFNSADLKVIVSAGVNFEVQKTRAVQMLIELSQALPGMAQLINNPKGLAILSDNLSIRGADQLKQMAEEEAKQIEAQKGISQPPSPIQQKMALDHAKFVSQDQNEKASLGIRNKEANTKRMEVLSKSLDAKAKVALQAEKDDTERMVHGIKLGIAKSSSDGKIAKDIMDSAANLVNANPIIPTNQTEAYELGQTEPQAPIVP
ncbi:MAG: portal protein [Candidatus Nitrosocosmicus sp.]